MVYVGTGGDQHCSDLVVVLVDSPGQGRVACLRRKKVSCFWQVISLRGGGKSVIFGKSPAYEEKSQLFLVFEVKKGQSFLVSHLSKGGGGVSYFWQVTCLREKKRLVIFGKSLFYGGKRSVVLGKSPI